MAIEEVVMEYVRSGLEIRGAEHR